jgi:hypothetical protein
MINELLPPSGDRGERIYKELLFLSTFRKELLNYGIY